MKICCGYSLEATRGGASSEYPLHMFSQRNKKNIMWISRLNWSYVRIYSFCKNVMVLDLKLLGVPYTMQNTCYHCEDASALIFCLTSTVYVYFSFIVRLGYFFVHLFALCTYLYHFFLLFHALKRLQSAL